MHSLWNDTKNLIRLTLLYVGVIKLVTIRSPSLQLILAQMPFCEDILLTVTVCFRADEKFWLFCSFFLWTIWKSLQIGVSQKNHGLCVTKAFVKETWQDMRLLCSFSTGFVSRNLIFMQHSECLYSECTIATIFLKYSGREWERMTDRIVSPLLSAEKKTEFLLIGPWAQCCRIIPLVERLWKITFCKRGFF